MSYTRDSSKDLVWDENSNSYVSESTEPTTIAEAIAAAQQRVAAVYTAILNKGGTLPATQNLSNLPIAIDSIPSSGGQTYSYPNLIGNYFVLDDDSVVPICFDTVRTNGATYSAIVLLETPNGLRYISYGNTDTKSAASPGEFNNYTWSTSGTGWLGNHTIKHISFGFLSTLTTDVIFTGSFSDGNLPIANTLTSIKIYNMNQLAIRQAAFKGCTNLTEVDVSTVDSIPLSMALGGSNAIGGAFTNCTSLQNIYWSSLKTTSFGSSYKNQFNNMLKGITGCTLHFPSNLETIISGLTGYPNFGGTNTVILFDLPSTALATATFTLNITNNSGQSIQTIIINNETKYTYGNGTEPTTLSYSYPGETQISWSIETVGPGTITKNGTLILDKNTTVDVTLDAAQASGCCIPYYTPVNYYNGTTKNANEVEVGDKLLGYNENTNNFEEVEVLDIIHKQRNKLVKITTENNEIEITPDHPILTDQGWAVYDIDNSKQYEFEKIQLTNSLKLLNKDGNYEDILSIEYRELENPISTYTFNVTNEIDSYVASNFVSHNIDFNGCTY